MKFSQLLYWTLIFVPSIVIGQTQSEGKETSEALVSPAIKQEAQVQKDSKPNERLYWRRNRIGIGIGITAGDATLGRETLALSALYGYMLSPTVELETTIHHAGIMTGFQSIRTLSSTWMFNTCVIVEPFSQVEGLRIGFGASLRSQGANAQSFQNLIDANSGQFLARDTVLLFQETKALGGTVKIEYLHSLHSRCEVSIYAQGSVYAAPFIGEQQFSIITLGGAVQLGLCLRAKW